MRKLEKISYKQFEKDLGEYNSREYYDSLSIPIRHTKNAAGYDFHAPFPFTLNPGEIIKMPTGIKVIMEDDELFMIVDRSSTGFNYNIRICNQVGIIDADYYNNEKNEGHMLIAFQNEGLKPWFVEKGDRVAQGIFIKYLVVDNEENTTNARTGGIGNTSGRSDENE